MSEAIVGAREFTRSMGKWLRTCINDIVYVVSCRYHYNANGQSYIDLLKELAKQK